MSGAPEVKGRRTLSTYGLDRGRFGPFYRQTVRWLGRWLEQLGGALESWSWRWRS